MEGVTGSFPKEMEIREIHHAVPKSVEPDLKNLKTMEEIWMHLEDEYGDVVELVTKLVNGLVRFQFPKDAKTEGQKFIKLHKNWNQVVTDLDEVKKLNCLDNELTISTIARKLPSQTSREEYV